MIIVQIYAILVSQFPEDRNQFICDLMFTFGIEEISLYSAPDGLGNKRYLLRAYDFIEDKLFLLDKSEDGFYHLIYIKEPDSVYYGEQECLWDMLENGLCSANGQLVAPRRNPVNYHLLSSQRDDGELDSYQKCVWEPSTKGSRLYAYPSFEEESKFSKLREALFEQWTELRSVLMWVDESEWGNVLVVCYEGTEGVFEIKSFLVNGEGWKLLTTTDIKYGLSYEIEEVEILE